MDDLTIILPELTDMTSSGLKVFEGLDRLWRIVERYKMTAPITITVVDKTARHVRAIRGDRIQDAWQLEDIRTAETPPFQSEFEFPLTLNVQDAKGNILKIRLQLAAAKRELSQKNFDPR